MRPLAFILLTCFAPILFAQEPAAVKLQSQARTAIFEHRFDDALAIYRTLLKQTSANVDDLVWIARLSAWNGDSPTALQYYTEALALKPDNVDALVGKANLLMWKHSYQEAAPLLTRARELAPSNTDVELAWSRFYHWQGDDATSKLHLARVLDLDRENQEALRLKEQIVPVHSIELRVSYEGDTLPGLPLGSIGEIGARFFSRRDEIAVAVGELARFGQTATRGGLRFSRTLDRGLNLHATASFGVGGDIVPKLDLSLGASRKLPSGFVLGVDYRYMGYRSTRVDSAAVSLDYYFEKPVWLQSSFAENWQNTQVTSSFLLKANSRLTSRLSANIGYGRGTQVFQLTSPAAFGNFNLDSYLAGVGLTLNKTTRLEAGYTFARRSTGALQNSFILSLVHLL